MINRAAVDERVQEWGLREDIIEKDYVLGWLLAGIAAHPRLRDTWVFKGGTCLKKCYFETYRFSEDLDFTITNGGPETPGELLNIFREVAGWIYQESGIEIPADEIRFEQHRNPRGNPATLGRIPYRGPRAPRGALPRITLDITADELLVRPPTRKEIGHAYPDRFPGDVHILAYDHVEIFAEKIRALAERLRPRDLYDVVNLFWRPQKPQPHEVRETLEAKCTFKGIPVPTAETLEAAAGRDELETEWENMLSHQVADLPPLNHYWQRLPDVFDWLAEIAVPEELSRAPADANEEPTWSPPATLSTWGVGIPLEKIRYAGANHLCVDLGYQGSVRTIEPYSLRQTQDGNLLLHAIRVDNSEHRSYRVDRIESVRVTERAFRPVYVVEFSPSGPIHALPAATRTTEHQPRYRRSRNRSGPTHIIECMTCGRKFRRKTQDTTLRPHKSRDGWDCYGRMGYLIETRYD